MGYVKLGKTHLLKLLKSQSGSLGDFFGNRKYVNGRVVTIVKINNVWLIKCRIYTHLDNPAKQCSQKSKMYKEKTSVYWRTDEADRRIAAPLGRRLADAFPLSHELIPVHARVVDGVAHGDSLARVHASVRRDVRLRAACRHNCDQSDLKRY